jgi:hypothetical protein
MQRSSRPHTARLPTSLLGLCVAVLIMVTAQPAAAHGNPGNYVTEITSLQPAVPGLSVSVESDGSFLTINNKTGGTVIVMGYEQEAYLKITARGVWKNTVSPTSYLNQGRSKDEIPAEVNTGATPTWDQVSDSNTYRYHDHRIDWMGSGRPAVVSSNVNAHHLIKNWSVDLLVDGTPVTIHGTLSWSPNGFGPGEWLLVVVGLALMIGILIAMAASSRRLSLQI